MTIVSHKHKFIFLRSRKTASSTCMVVLAKYCGPEDIINKAGDLKRHGFSELCDQNNILKIPSTKVNFVCSIFSDIRNGRWPRIRRAAFHKMKLFPHRHAEAVSVRAAVGEETWNAYYKFCFVRNPYDRLVSEYFYKTRKLQSKPTFSEFAKYIINNPKELWYFSNRRFYEIDGELAVNGVYRFENLEKELQSIFNHLGMIWDGWLPHTKGEFRPKKNYRQYYDNELRYECEKAFAHELALFEYKF